MKILITGATRRTPIAPHSMATRRRPVRACRLNLAADLKLGTNHLNEIAVVGASIADVRRQFKPAI